MNKAILIGNLGADPEIKYGQSGTAVLKLRIATTESWFDKNKNERQSDTQWHSIVLFGKRAEALNKILAKGRTICVEGRITYEQWEDKNGVKRTSTVIKAHEVILLGGGDRSGSREQTADRAPGNSSSGFGGDSDGEFSDSDVPF